MEVQRTVSEWNINTSLYPAAKLTLFLTVHEANSQMFHFLGERQCFSLYKIVREDDVESLRTAVEKCNRMSSEDDISLCIHLQNVQGEYEKHVVTLRKCDGINYVYAELRSIGNDDKKIKELGSRLELLQDYLTINGRALSVYSPEDDMFRLFWMDYSQVVDICELPLREWRKQTLEKGYVAEKDVKVFENFCDILTGGSSEQTFQFSGKILSYGDNMDGYKIQIVPRMYQGKKLVLGVWSIVNIRTGEQADDYLEGTFVDSLTKILNKKSITEYALKTVKPGSQVAVAILDIDYFKNVNDTYGHLFGDQVIAAVADVIKNVIGRNGMAGRIGGDEFMVILKGYGDESGLRSYLRSIKFNVSMLFLDRVGDNRLSCSIGASQCSIDSNDYNELFRIADKALYIAKQKGRNRFVIYDVKKHGQFNKAGASSDMTEIRESFYSEKDMFQLNKLLAEMVLKGRECLPELLEHIAHTMMIDGIVMFWGKEREEIARYPAEYLWDREELHTFEEEGYLSRFQDDLLICTNTNFFEYSQPQVFDTLKKRKVLSYMQFLLRDREGNINGMVSLEVCRNRNHFPKLAVQLFENMCRIVNAVLIREIPLDK